MGAYGVVGDPAGMRALADDLVSKAGRLRDAKGRVDKSWTKVDWTGPLFDTMSARASAATARFPGAADQLDGLAKLLRSSAHEVEVQQAAAHRKQEAERAQADADAKRTAGP